MGKQYIRQMWKLAKQEHAIPLIASAIAVAAIPAKALTVGIRGENDMTGVQMLSCFSAAMLVVVGVQVARGAYRMTAQGQRYQGPK